MDQGYRILGFVVIVILYAVIGLMAAAGTIFIARKILAPKAEQIFYAMFLIMIAGFYLAFAAYFGVATAWRLETAVVLAFVALALPGARLPLFLIIGYSLHAHTDPARLRSFLCSLRLLHGGVFLYATRRVDCCVEGSAA
jgi:hypothetical protein